MELLNAGPLNERAPRRGARNRRPKAGGRRCAQTPTTAPFASFGLATLTSMRSSEWIFTLSTLIHNRSQKEKRSKKERGPAYEGPFSRPNDRTFLFSCNSHQKDPKRSRKVESCQICPIKILATQKSSVLRVPRGSPGGYRTTFSSPGGDFRPLGTVISCRLANSLLLTFKVSTSLYLFAFPTSYAEANSALSPSNRHRTSSKIPRSG